MLLAVPTVLATVLKESMHTFHSAFYSRHTDLHWYSRHTDLHWFTAGTLIYTDLQQVIYSNCPCNCSKAESRHTDLHWFTVSLIYAFYSRHTDLHWFTAGTLIYTDLQQAHWFTAGTLIYSRHTDLQQAHWFTLIYSRHTYLQQADWTEWKPMTLTGQDSSFGVFFYTFCGVCNNSVHFSCTHQRPEHSHDTY